MSPSTLGWITVALLGPIGAVLLIKFRGPIESGRVQRYPRITVYAYLMGAIIFLGLGIGAAVTRESNWWASLFFALFGLGCLVLAYYHARYRLTATRNSIVIRDPFRGQIHITRSNSTWRYAGSLRGQEITQFTLDDGRKIRVYSPLFDIRPYTFRR